jgi:competence ComEA-like helix-hairpin-helix protein
MRVDRLTFCISICVGAMICVAALSALAEDPQSENNERIDINCAVLEQLCSLPGINRKLANDIIQYRNEKGAFKSKQQLTKVPGITPELFKALSPWLMEISPDNCKVPDSHPSDNGWEEEPVMDIPRC